MSLTQPTTPWLEFFLGLATSVSVLPVPSLGLVTSVSVLPVPSLGLSTLVSVLPVPSLGLSTSVSCFILSTFSTMISLLVDKFDLRTSFICSDVT